LLDNVVITNIYNINLYFDENNIMNNRRSCIETTVYVTVTVTEVR